MTGSKAHLIEVTEPLSNTIMPSEVGEFYAYASQFSENTPLYFLMKCKANKFHSIQTDANDIMQELDLVFIFNNEGVLLSSPTFMHATHLLSGSITDTQSLSNTGIKVCDLTEQQFQTYCMERNGENLVNIYEDSANDSSSSVALSEGMILSVKTASNKYGLILITNLTASTCEIEACHILLPNA